MIHSILSHPIAIDLSSDTQTRPGAAMRVAMAEAPVGDEQKGEDPTTNALQERIAELTGKEAALFLPSGAMCNQIAYRVWGRPGDEIILERTSHPIHYEVGAAAALSGLQFAPLDGDRGRFTADQAQAAIRPSGLRHYPKTCCVSVEQTTNRGGGAIWDLEELIRLGDLCTVHSLPLHMDGARLMNAVVATGITAASYAAPCSSVWVDLSKGLGCPVGAVLAGSADFIEEAFRVKHQFGGAMRQSGILAAAGLYALDNLVPRLADDHQNAKALAQGLATIDGLWIRPDLVDTNIVYFDIAGTGLSGTAFCEGLLANSGVRIGVSEGTVLRAVTHLDVKRSDIPVAIEAVKTFVKEKAPGAA